MNGLKKLFSKKYILASKSPRRAQLLNQIGLKFAAIDSKSKELEYGNHDPVKIVKHNSLLKSRLVAVMYRKEIVIGADTIVELNGRILNKPKNLIQAKSFLKTLSGKIHTVYTGVNIINAKSGKELFDYEMTKVHFRKLEKDEIDFYVKHFKPLDKAGAYGIQDDFGCLFIDKIEGDYYNIVGLPLLMLYRNLKKII